MKSLWDYATVVEPLFPEHLAQYPLFHSTEYQTDAGQLQNENKHISILFLSPTVYVSILISKLCIHALCNRTLQPFIYYTTHCT